MFNKEQEFKGCLYIQAEVLVELTNLFKEAKTTKEIFLESYHLYYGPETRSKPCGVVSAQVDKDLTSAQRDNILPSYIMSAYHVKCLGKLD